MQEGKSTLDFIVIGAQKAGTTSLFRHLAEHPEIALPQGKEWPCFSHDRVFERGFDAYMANMLRNGYRERPSVQAKWGTVTPQYMVGGVYQRNSDVEGYDERTVPARMQRCLPAVRLVAILRDPVQRAISHHRMAAMRGQERRAFDSAVAELLAPGALERARRLPEETSGYVAWGEYGRILAGYLDVFSPEQLLVVFTDELEHAPEQLLARVHCFIGVSPGMMPGNLGERFRVGEAVAGFSWQSPSSWLSPASPLGPHGIGRALRRNPAARSAWHRISPAAQLRLRGRYDQLRRRLAARNRRRAPAAAPAHQPPGEATIERLREHYAHDAEILRALGFTPAWPGA